MKKDLNYYLQNPDELPEPEELEKLTEEARLAAMEAGQEELTVDRFVAPEEVKDDTKGEPSAAEAKVETKTEEKPVEEKTEPEPEKKPDGVLAKDGKNVIPYAVLTTARERAETAERIAREQAAEIERLKAENKEAPVETETLSDEELDALAEDSPTLAKILRAQQSTLKAQQSTIQQLNGTVQTLVKSDEQEAAAKQAEAKSAVQAAIDANPTLSAWMVDEDQTMWKQAKDFDNVLKNSPAYRDKSFEERFAKVVELTQAALGIETQAKADEPELTQSQIKAVAEAKLKEKSKKTVPVSLSQIPGGAPPAVDERDRVENMSPVELGNKLLGMKSQEEIKAYLASL